MVFFLPISKHKPYILLALEWASRRLLPQTERLNRRQWSELDSSSKDEKMIQILPGLPKTFHFFTSLLPDHSLILWSTKRNLANVTGVLISLFSQNLQLNSIQAAYLRSAFFPFNQKQNKGKRMACATISYLSGDFSKMPARFCKDRKTFKAVWVQNLQVTTNTSPQCPLSGLAWLDRKINLDWNYSQGTEINTLHVICNALEHINAAGGLSRK